MNDYGKETPFARQMRRKEARKLGEQAGSSDYQQTLGRAAESGRCEAILRATVERGPLVRGTPEWDERERARKALGAKCLSFGKVRRK